MNCFDNYSQYYDMLYHDKNYEAEAEYVSLLLKRYYPAAYSLCEMGCGTGRMARLMVDKGYSLHGVDMSAQMLAEAERMKLILPNSQAERLIFSQGDVRNVRFLSTFDCVISLFHVMSYQQTNDDLQAAFMTAGCHLKQGGLFIFDFWYGPAVLSQQPALRIKRCNNHEIRLIRIAEPNMRFNENLVDVNYHLLIIEEKTGLCREVFETHTMRYLFLPEIKAFLCEAGFELCDTQAWLTGEKPGTDSWGVCCVARKF